MPPHRRRRWGAHARASVTPAHAQRLEHVRRNDELPRRTHDRPPRWTWSVMLPHTWQVLLTIRSVLLGDQAVPL
jgi:hypothetical protein